MLTDELFASITYTMVGGPTSMASAIGMSRNAVNNMASGYSGVKAGIWRGLVRVLRSKAAEFIAAADRIETELNKLDAEPVRPKRRYRNDPPRVPGRVYVMPKRECRI